MPSSSVSALDCRTHTWHEAPSLQVERRSPSACVVGGKIYVAGGFEDDEDSDSLETIEVFDLKTQIWDNMHIPYQEKDWGWLTRSACIQGKFHLMVGGNVLAYDPEEVIWNLVEREMGESWIWISDCAIENVLYCYYRGVFKWYDTKVGLWKKVKGLNGLPKFSHYIHVKLADYGGKMAVFWETFVRSTRDKMIWCAVIALERHNIEDIWGKVKWCEAVLTVPKSTEFEYAIAATV